MIPYEPHRVLLSLGPLSIYSWGFMFGLAILVAFILFEREVKRKKGEVSHCTGIMTTIVCGALIGARLFYVIVEDPASFIASPSSIFKIWQGGLVMYGGFIGAVTGSYIYTRVKKINFWWYADAAVLSLAIGIFITRIGCFLNGCCYGLGSSLPWTLKFGEELSRHPTQIYHSLSGLFLFTLFTKLRHKKMFDGWLFLVFVMSYAVLRFIIEFMRDMPHYYGFTSAQWTGITVFIIAGVIYWYKGKKYKERKPKKK